MPTIEMYKLADKFPIGSRVRRRSGSLATVVPVTDYIAQKDPRVGWSYDSHGSVLKTSTGTYITIKTDGATRFEANIHTALTPEGVEPRPLHEVIDAAVHQTRDVADKIEARVREAYDLGYREGQRAAREAAPNEYGMGLTEGLAKAENLVRQERMRRDARAILDRYENPNV